MGIEKWLINKYGKGDRIRKEFKLIGFKVIFDWRKPGGLGRFGGGWDWDAGIQMGDSSIILKLLVFSFRIYKSKN